MIAVGDRVSCPTNERLYGGTVLERRHGTVRRIEHLEALGRSRALVLLDPVTARLDGGTIVMLKAVRVWYWIAAIQVSLLETLAHAAQEGVHGKEDREEEEDQGRQYDPPAFWWGEEDVGYDEDPGLFQDDPQEHFH